MSEIKIKKGKKHIRRAVVGFWIIIFFAALLLFLENAGFLTYSYGSAFVTWPLLLFILSIFRLFRRKWISGIFLLAAAKFFWIPIFKSRFPDLLPMIPEDGFVRKYWFILIVLFAFLMILKQLFGKRNRCCRGHHWEYSVKTNGCKKRASSTDEVNGFIESNVVFSSNDRIYLNEDFTGGEFNIVFGSQTIDLRKCIIRNNEKAVIEVNVVFSNCEIWIPADWNVQFKVEGVFSSIDDERSGKSAESDSKNVLVITGSCVFSSLEIKN